MYQLMLFKRFLLVNIVELNSLKFKFIVIL